MSDRAPAYPVPVLHFDALRLVALREGDRNEENLTPRVSYLLEESRRLVPSAPRQDERAKGDVASRRGRHTGT